MKARPGPGDYNLGQEIGKDAKAFRFGGHQEDPLKVKVGYHPSN